VSQKTGRRLKNTVVIVQYSDTSIDLASLMYFPESTKSVLIVAQHNLERAKSVFADLDFKVSTAGERYLGGFIGESSAQDKWLDRKIQYW
jgi:hypothetical protein